MNEQLVLIGANTDFRGTQTRGCIIDHGHHRTTLLLSSSLEGTGLTLSLGLCGVRDLLGLLGVRDRLGLLGVFDGL